MKETDEARAQYDVELSIIELLAHRFISKNNKCQVFSIVCLFQRKYIVTSECRFDFYFINTIPYSHFWSSLLFIACEALLVEANMMAIIVLSAAG